MCGWFKSVNLWIFHDDDDVSYKIIHSISKWHGYGDPNSVSCLLSDENWAKYDLLC